MKIINLNDFLKNYDIDIKILLKECEKTRELYKYQMLKKMISKKEINIQRQFGKIILFKDEYTDKYISLAKFFDYFLHWFDTTQGFNFWKKINQNFFQMINEINNTSEKYIKIIFQLNKAKNKSFYFERLKV